MDSVSITAGSERRGKIRGNRDSTLPIEDWAKGLTRAFSRKKSTAVKSQQPKFLETIPDIPLATTAEHNSAVFPPRSSSIAGSQQLSQNDQTSNGPIEDWMKTLPQRKPVPRARNPTRISLYDRPMTSNSFATSNSGSESSPIDSASIPTDWGSDFERELPSPNPYYEKCLNGLVDASSNIRVSETQEEAADKVSPLSSSQVSHEQLNLASATAAVKQASLRSLFFPGSQAKEGPRTMSVTSSDVVSRSRPLSTVSSIESFTTAYDGSDYAVEDDLPEEEDNNDTGIDEDYTKKDDQDDLDEPHYVYSDALLDQNFAQETVVELQDLDQISEAGSYSNEGTLEDVLVQVALSSPYASSESDVSSRSSLTADSIHDEAPASPTEMTSENSISLPDTDSVSSPISISSGSIQECRRVRPARHYKMINGLIVQYDPWRVPGQWEASRHSSLQSTGSDIPSSISDRSFHRSGNFISAGNKWSYTGAPMGIVA